MKLQAIGGPWDGELCEIDDDWREWDIPRLSVVDEDLQNPRAGTVYGAYWFAVRESRFLPIRRVEWPDDVERREMPDLLMWQDTRR